MHRLRSTGKDSARRNDSKSPPFAEAESKGNKKISSKSRIRKGKRLPCLQAALRTRPPERSRRTACTRGRLSEAARLPSPPSARSRSTGAPLGFVFRHVMSFLKHIAFLATTIPPLRKRMRGKVVVLVAVVGCDLASDPVRQGDDGLLVRELNLRRDKRRVRAAPLTALFHS